MRRLGLVTTTERGTGRATGSAVAALTLLMPGCGSGDPPIGGDKSPSPSTPAATSPSTEATPSVLDGGTQLEHPAFTVTVPPGYELYEEDNAGEFSNWSRIYSLRKSGLASLTLTHDTNNVSPIDKELESIKDDLYSRGAKRDTIKRLEDITLAGQPTAHVIGTSDSLEAHAYVIDIGDQYLEIFLERTPEDTQQKRIQQAVLESIRLTE